MANKQPFPAAEGPEQEIYQPSAGDFEIIGADAGSREAIARPSVSFWKDAMHRLFRNKAAIVCLIALALIVLGAVLFPMFSPYLYSDQHTSHTNVGFMFRDPDDGHLHIFGTDGLGRDMWVRVWQGARVSLFIALAAVTFNLVVGMIYGGVSGYFGGVVDNLMMRFVEVINGIPYLMLVILLMMVVPRGMASMIIAYGLVGWTGMARLVRGQIVSLKEQEYVVAAEAMGATPSRIIRSHLLPNTLSVIIVNITLAIPNVIFSEAFLSFVGIGLPPPQPSWGVLANEGQKVFQMYPSQLIVPSIFICVTMLAFNLLGDALRDSFDPKLRR